MESTIGLGTVGATQAKSSYLDTLARELADYRELLNVLQERLNSVSERKPEELSAADSSHTPGLHVANLIDSIRTNNRVLQQIINELVI